MEPRGLEPQPPHCQSDLDSVFYLRLRRNCWVAVQLAAVGCVLKQLGGVEMIIVLQVSSRYGRVNDGGNGLSPAAS